MHHIDGHVMEIHAVEVLEYVLSPPESQEVASLSSKKVPGVSARGVFGKSFIGGF